MKDNFFKDFYGGKGLQVPSGREAKDMNKSFYEEEQPGVRELSKSGGLVNPVAVLEYHMKKASDTEGKKKKDKMGGLNDA